MLNTLVYNNSVRNGSHSVLYNATHVNADVHKGARCV